MATRAYQLTIVRYEPNPNYHPSIGPYGPCSKSEEHIAVREVEARITEEELDIIKQALLKVWK